MKKLNFHFIFSVVIICALTACNKNSEEGMTVLISDKTTGSLTEARIMAFIQKMNNPLKSGEEYTTDSTVWYLEATLNYTYCTYDSSMLFLSRDTSLCSIDLNENGKVDETDLGDAYAKMLDSLEYHYDNATTNYKHPFYCDVVEIGVENGVLELRLVTVIACGYNPIQYAPFGETDYWYSILDYGMCADSVGQHIGEDASDRIEYKLLHPLIVPIGGYRVTWPVIETIPEIYPNDYPYEPAPRDYRLFYYYGLGVMDDPQCLDPDELNFYISSNGIPYIIDAEEPEGLEFFSIDVIDQLSPGDDYWIEIHSVNISYGEKLLTQIPPSPL